MQKNVMLPNLLVSNASMASTVTSKAIPIQWLDNVSIQISFTGTPTGIFYVQGSSDGGNVFVNMTLSPVPIASGAAGNILIDMNQVAAPIIRLQYVPTSGTGTLNAWVSSKEV